MKQFTIWSSAILVVAGCIGVSQARAQSGDASGDRKTFEVISIKRSDPSESQRSLAVTPGGRFTATAATLKGLIMLAYNVGPDKLTGATGWMESEKYDVVATPPEGAIKGSVGRQAQFTGPNGQGSKWTALPDSEDGRQIREMLQALLEDRFQLKLRGETKEMPIYALSVAKQGPKLQESKSETAQMRSGSGLGEVDFQGAPISLLAAVLTRLTGRPILDRTGLKGSYDFKVQWTPDESQMQMFRGTGGGAAANMTSASEPSGPSIFTALQEQLGLKLEPTKGPVETFVVDRAEKPSEN